MKQGSTDNRCPQEPLAGLPDKTREAPMLSNSTEIRFLDKPQVLRVVPVSPTGLHELMTQAGFPRPYVLNADPATTNGKSYWLRHEIEQWMMSRPKRILKNRSEDSES